MAKFKCITKRYDTFTYGRVYNGEGLAAQPDGKFSALLTNNKGTQLHFWINTDEFKLIEETTVTNQERLAELKTSIALAQKQALELEEAMKKEECVGSMWKRSTFKAEGAWATMRELRQCEGSEEAKDGVKQFVIEGEECIDYWHDIAFKIRCISPCFKTREHTQAAIDKVGKERIAEMFNTFHSKG